MNSKLGAQVRALEHQLRSGGQFCEAHGDSEVVATKTELDLASGCRRRTAQQYVQEDADTARVLTHVLNGTDRSQLLRVG